MHGAVPDIRWVLEIVESVEPSSRADLEISAVNERNLAQEDRQGLTIGCIEQIARRVGWIDETKLLELAAPLAKSDYGEYVQLISQNAHFGESIASKSGV